MERPAVLPSWATNNPVDGTSGIAAIVEPSSGKKLSGFLRKEKPPRQDLNWLHNTTGNWLKFLDKGITKSFLEGFQLQSIVQGGGDISVQISHGACYMEQPEALINSYRVAGSSSLIKNLVISGVSEPWVAGSSEAGWAGSSPISSLSWVHLFILYFDGTDSIDLAFDDSSDGFNAASIPGVAGVRRVCSLYYYDLGTPTVLKMKQQGDYFCLLSKLGGNFSKSSADSSISIPTPTNLDVVANLSLVVRPASSSSTAIWIDDFDISENIEQTDHAFAQYIAATGVNFPTKDTRLYSIGSSGLVKIKITGAGSWGINYRLLGFFDYRGKDTSEGF